MLPDSRSQINKFEQVSSDHLQMLLVGGTLQCDLSHDAFDVTHPPPFGQNDW